MTTFKPGSNVALVRKRRSPEQGEIIAALALAPPLLLIGLNIEYYLIRCAEDGAIEIWSSDEITDPMHVRWKRDKCEFSEPPEVTSCDHPWHGNPGLVTPCPQCSVRR